MFLTILTLIIIGTLFRPPPRTTGEALDRFQIASYRRGTIAHLTPVDEDDHTEDEHGECSCNPQAGPYPLNNGRTGILYVHRLIANDNDRRTR
ncbi:MAG TPA: hypothetical protein VFP34_11880 [Microlunatus sp.]|nr:hypothetical protein [Microlunatus sp.]